jgi:hypothetical protein
MFDLLRPGAAFSKKNRAVWDEQDWLKVENCLRAKLFPKKKGYKVPAECQEAWNFALYIEFFLIISPEKVQIDLEHDEACRLSRACEIMARVGMGQFKDMIELFNSKLDWNEQTVIERDLKERLFPEVGQGYYAMHSNKCSEECQVAWDCYQHIRREVSWYGVGKDWRKDKREFCNGMLGVCFDEPFKVSKLEGDFKTERIEK